MGYTTLLKIILVHLKSKFNRCPIFLFATSVHLFNRTTPLPLYSNQNFQNLRVIYTTKFLPPTKTQVLTLPNWSWISVKQDGFRLDPSSRLSKVFLSSLFVLFKNMTCCMENVMEQTSFQCRDIHGRKMWESTRIFNLPNLRIPQSYGGFSESVIPIPFSLLV